MTQIEDAIKVDRRRVIKLEIEELKKAIKALNKNLTKLKIENKEIVIILNQLKILEGKI